MSGSANAARRCRSTAVNRETALDGASWTVGDRIDVRMNEMSSVDSSGPVFPRGSWNRAMAGNQSPQSVVSGARASVRAASPPTTG
jgi:hypothetical protein